MENASKALIIAGAILLSILIISLGIMIYNQAAGVVNNNSMDELEITQFNEKFTQYCGSNVRGANVNALKHAIDTNNRVQEDEGKKVTIVGADSISTGKVYTVKVTGRTNGGLINEITVAEGANQTIQDAE